MKTAAKCSDRVLPSFLSLSLPACYARHTRLMECARFCCEPREFILRARASLAKFSSTPSHTRSRSFPSLEMQTLERAIHRDSGKSIVICSAESCESVIFRNGNVFPWQKPLTGSMPYDRFGRICLEPRPHPRRRHFVANFVYDVNSVTWLCSRSRARAHDFLLFFSSFYRRSTASSAYTRARARVCERDDGKCAARARARMHARVSVN